MKRAKNVIDIETKINNGLVVIGSDIHIPFQDDRAVACFVKYCKEKQPEAIVLNGDVLDMFMLSKFTKGEGRNPLEEITMCRGLLEMIRKACPTSEIYYVIGNHENRLEKYVLSKAPELASLIEDVFSIIKTEDFKIRGCASLTINDNFVCKHGTLLGNKSGLSAIKEMENAYMSGATGHCFSEDVEVLTQRGWKKIIDINPDRDLVGTYNKETGAFEYNEVREKFVYDNYQKLYHIKSNCIDIMTTDKHGFIGYDRKRELKEFTAEELPSIGRISIPLACKKNLVIPINSSDTELRLLVNICADASIEGDSFRFHLKKERKIQHLKELLQELGLEYSERKQSCGTTKIRISTKDSKHYLDRYFPDKNKVLPQIIRWASPDQARVILEEYSITDGCKNSVSKNSYQISTSKKEEADILQELFVKSGMRSSVFKRVTGNYCITVNLRDETLIDGKRNVTIVPYSGRVSCVSVDNGTLVIRSKGKTIITQNTHRLCKYIARKSGRKFVWLETGCLCDLNPEYCVNPNWQAGFAELKFKDNKLYHSRVIEIEKGKILE
jgi:predicted phosphodiesterase|nr:MAG TPA_asm: Calcineurin-like phosphoesterase [Caudoviricetes sp.]